MRKKILILTFLILLIIFGIFKLIKFLKIDSCLDNGGSWNYELNKCDTIDKTDINLYWHTEFDSIIQMEYLVKGNLIDKISSSPFEMIEILNNRDTKCKIKLINISNDTIYIKIIDDEYLTEQMGSCGANCYLGETVYSLTEDSQIKFINISMDYRSHASPGIYTRKDFWELENNAKFKIIGAWGDDDNENAIFAFYKDSVYYPDPDIWYKYDLNIDTLFINRKPGFNKILIENINDDSMTLLMR